MHLTIREGYASRTLCYIAGEELPDVELTLQDHNGDLIDLSGDWDFELRIALPDDTVHVKTTGITGAATDPNATIVWDLNELSDFDPWTYDCQLWARNDADRDRVFHFRLKISEAIVAA